LFQFSLEKIQVIHENTKPARQTAGFFFLIESFDCLFVETINQNGKLFNRENISKSNEIRKKSSFIAKTQKS
jgi:hypothetical protein